jgi:hypothetical protein
MKNPHRIVFLFIQFPMNRVGKMVLRQYQARFQCEGLFIIKYIVSQN